MLKEKVYIFTLLKSFTKCGFRRRSCDLEKANKVVIKLIKTKSFI